MKPLFISTHPLFLKIPSQSLTYSLPYTTKITSYLPFRRDYFTVNSSPIRYPYGLLSDTVLSRDEFPRLRSCTDHTTYLSFFWSPRPHIILSHHTILHSSFINSLSLVHPENWIHFLKLKRTLPSPSLTTPNTSLHRIY